MISTNGERYSEVTDEERTDTVTDFLERYFPFAAPWEQAEMDRVAREAAEQERRTLRADGPQGSIES